MIVPSQLAEVVYDEGALNDMTRGGVAEVGITSRRGTMNRLNCLVKFYLTPADLLQGLFPFIQYL